MPATKPKPKPIFENSLATPQASLGRKGGDDCVVASGTEIDGNFCSKQNVRLDGTIIGDVLCENRFVMEKTARIVGTVRAKDAVIMGIIEGDIFAEGTIHLKSTAIIKGNISASQLIVDEGAHYIGDCQVGVVEKF